MQFVLPLFLIIFKVIKVKSDCSMIQDCTNVTNPKCRPRPTEGNETHTKPMISDPALYQFCPDFKPGEEVCCTNVSLAALENNFHTIDQIFGSPGQGCDICAVNLKKFWCHFACAPNQAEFLKMKGLSNHTVGPDDVRELEDIDLYVEDNTMCETFHSCKKTKFTTQVPAMGNSLGFLNFQGVNAYQKIACFIYIKQAQGFGIKYKSHLCDELPDKDGYVGGYKIAQNCTCTTCNAYCDYSLVSKTPVFEGLSIAIICGVYGVTILITGLLIFFRIKYKGGLDVIEDYDIEIGDITVDACNFSA